MKATIKPEPVLGDLIIQALRGLKESNVYELPGALRGIVHDAKAVSGKRAVTRFREMFTRCAICGFDEALDWHHLVVVDYKKPLMADGTYYQHCLGVIRLCPNHHALVHRKEEK